MTKIDKQKTGKKGNKLGKVAFPGGFRWRAAVRGYAQDFPTFPISDDVAVEALRGGCALCHFCDTGDSQLRTALRLYLWREGDDLRVFCKGCRPKPKRVSWETRQAWSRAGRQSRGRKLSSEARGHMSQAQKDRWADSSIEERREITEAARRTKQLTSQQPQSE